MKKKKLVIGNWKMNVMIVPEAKKLASGVKKKTAKVKKTEVVFCPPSIYLQTVAGITKGKKSGKWKLGVQNVSSEDMGAHTGEISAMQLKQFDVSYCIVGHSERRKMGETDEMVAKKIQAVLRADIVPVLCIGESARDEEGAYLQFIKNQIVKALSGVQKGAISSIVIAYEPVWAIGAKSAMSPRDLHEMTLYIKKCLRELFATYAEGVMILYGGSVTAQNAGEIVREGFVDGLLVGRDSLDAQNFSDIVKAVDAVK
jgi:triosephosphate isomerase